MCKAEFSEQGVITIDVNSETAITDAEELAALKFHTEEKDAYSTQIDLKCSETMTLSAGEEIPVDNATINNKIYFLKEVG